MRRRTAVWLGIPVVLTVAVVRNAEVILFDESRPGWARDHEWVDGKQAVWGPAPRTLVSASFSGTERHYTGNEWYYRWCRDYCREWAAKNGYGYPK